MAKMRGPTNRYVVKRELQCIKSLNKNIGEDFYIEKNKNKYGWDAVVYKLNKTEKYLQWNFCGYVELEHADRGKAEDYKNISRYPEWRLLLRKFFLKTEDDDLSDIQRDNLDRSLYLKYTSDLKLSFIIPMDYAMEVGTFRKNLRKNNKPYYENIKQYQDYYLGIDPDEFITEEAPNILTKKDKCVQYIRDFFGNKEPMVYGSKRRRKRV